jgi:phosphoesterase RecJ-like protein
MITPKKSDAYPMDEKVLQDAFRELQSARRVSVISHIRPDGDAVGSLIGLGLSLQTVGKDVQMILAEGIPTIYRHLDGSDQISAQITGDSDLVVVVDCSDLSRVGGTLNENEVPDINLDHHPTNTQYARYNLVDENAVATAEILAEYLPHFDFPITNQVADALLFGMITDTLGFRTFNITPKALRLTANLMEAGGDLPHLYQRGLLQRSFEAARYWGAGLSSLQRRGRMVWTTLTLKDKLAVGYPGKDDADLINVLSTIDEIDIMIVFIEQEKGYVKVSWRSKPGFDVSQVASCFGGGGHKAAAGAKITGKLKVIQEDVLTTTQSMLELKY